MIKYFEMSVLGPEIIKGNIRSVETEKLDDCSKNTMIIHHLVNYIILSGISIPNPETCSNAVANG